MQPTTFDRRRDEFPTLARGIHLLSHSLGPVPRAARDSMLDYVQRWEDHAGEDAWAASWWELSTEVGDRLARLMGAAPGSVQVQPNASVAMSAVASCFDFARGPRRKVVTTALDFPSMGYVWQAQQRVGAQVVVVPSDDDVTVSTERICEAIDENTCLVALSHVSYRSSYKIDAAAIIRCAHDVGAKVLLDVYQSIGVVELDAAGWEADFLIGGTIKWLCGGPACGFLYVRPDLITALEPRLTGWIAHARPFDFSHGPMIYDASVRRFAQGTPNIPGLYSVLPGLKMIERIGVAAIAAESRRRTQHMVEFAQAAGWRLHSPPDVQQRGGTVMIETDRPEEMVGKLSERRVFVDGRPGVGLRLSPHFFNTDEELDQALAILHELMSSSRDGR